MEETQNKSEAYYAFFCYCVTTEAPMKDTHHRKNRLGTVNVSFLHGGRSTKFGRFTPMDTQLSLSYDTSHHSLDIYKITLLAHEGYNYEAIKRMHSRNDTHNFQNCSSLPVSQAACHTITEYIPDYSIFIQSCLTIQDSLPYFSRSHF